MAGLYGEKSARQRARLQSLFAQPPTVTPPGTEVDPDALDMYPGGDGEIGKGAQHGKAFSEMTSKELNDYASKQAKGNLVERNMFSGLSGLVGPLGWGAMLSNLEDSQLAAELGARGFSNPGDFVGGQIAGAAGTGMNVAGGVANPELAGRSDASQGGNAGGPPGGGVSAADLGASLAEGNANGLFNKGGRVKKQSSLFPINPPGPDNVVIGAKTGERIITDEDYASFKPETKADIDAAMKRAEARRKKR